MALRTVGVRLLAETSAFTRNFKGAEKAVADVAKAGEKADTQFRATSGAARKLDSQIGATKKELAQLATAFANAQSAAEKLDLQKSMRGKQAELRQLTNARNLLPDEQELQAGAEKARRNLDGVADTAGVMGLAVAAGFGVAVKAGMDFDRQMSAVSAATHATAGDMERLRAAALQAGKDTSYSATEAAQGIEELSKAGVSTSAVLNGGLNGALALAAAGGLDVGEAAETAASAMTQFKLKGSDVPHIADLLAAAAGKAQGSVHDMGYALSQAGLVANQMGLSIEDTTGTLAAFASAGLLGSDAGTSMKTMFLALANPSGKAAELMDELGIKAYDATGKFVGITSLAGQLKDRLGGLTQEQRNAALATIFGSDAIRAASVLYDQGAKGIQDWIDKTNDAGYAAETAAARTDNLAGDIERLQGSLETLAIESSTGASSALRTLVQGADNLVASVSSIPGPVQSAVVGIAGVGGAALLAASGAAKLRSASADALDQLSRTGPIGQKAASGLDKAGKAAGRTAIALAAIQTAAALMGDSINPQLDALAKRMTDFANTGEAGGEAARIFGDDMGILDMALKDVADTGAWSDFARGAAGMIEGMTGLGSVMDSSLQHSKERLEALDDALKQMVQSGKGEEAAAIFKKVAERAAEQGVSVKELNKVLPGYAASLETTGAAAGDAVSPTSSLTGQTREYKTAADAAAAAARGQRDALAALSLMMKAETDPVFGLIDAEQDLAKAQKEAAKAVKEHGRNSDEAKEATRKLALAAIELQGKAGELAGTFDGNMTPALYATLKAAGLTDRQIKDVAGQFRQAKKDADKYDGEYKANASAPGAAAADKQLKNAKAKADAFDGTYKATIDVVGYPVALDRLKRLSTYQQALKKGTIPANFQGPVQGRDYAVGGWTGPGSMWQPAGVVHADEFVIRKSSRRSIEDQAPGLLDFMNQHGSVPEDVVDATPGYARGGLVWPYPTTSAKTRIPSRSEVAAVVTPPIPTSGATGPAIVAAVRAAFPELHAISTYRAGAVTLTGNRSYHASNRAVDFPASRELAQWWNAHYMARTKELISPWNDLNILNGRRHTYTGAVYNQHNFAGGNAHDHIAMAQGGLIAEPVIGRGVATGRSYSFAERGPEWVLPQGGQLGGGGSTVTVNVMVPPTVNKAEVGREIARTLDEWARSNGVKWR